MMRRGSWTSASRGTRPPPRRPGRRPHPTLASFPFQGTPGSRRGHLPHARSLVEYRGAPTAEHGCSERWGVWGAMSGTPIPLDAPRLDDGQTSVDDSGDGSARLPGFEEVQAMTQSLTDQIQTSRFGVV